MKQLETRKQKITLLNDISTGKATVSELQPVVIELWKRFKEEAMWTNEKTSESLTDEQLQERKATLTKRDSNSIIFITAHSSPKQ